MQFLSSLNRLRPSSATQWAWAAATVALIAFYVGSFVVMKSRSHSIVTQFREGLVNSARSHPISLGSRLKYCRRCNGHTAAPLMDGWSDPENWGTWTEGQIATLIAPLPEGSPSTLRLAIRANAIVDREPQVVEVAVNGERIGAWQFDSRGTVVRCLEFPKAVALRQSPAIITLRIARPVAPWSIGDSGDHRLLGLGLMEMEISDANVTRGDPLKCPTS
jgi:Domain of unknown function (DUF7024)